MKVMSVPGERCPGTPKMEKSRSHNTNMFFRDREVNAKNVN